jgi:hypothetical protein
MITIVKNIVLIFEHILYCDNKLCVVKDCPNVGCAVLRSTILSGRLSTEKTVTMRCQNVVVICVGRL